MGRCPEHQVPVREDFLYIIYMHGKQFWVLCTHIVSSIWICGTHMRLGPEFLVPTWEEILAYVYQDEKSNISYTCMGRDPT